MARIAALFLPAILLAACNGEVYLRDGVTDGDTFYLAPQALVDDDPVLQSWTSYSLTLGACKLALGGDNPARASSFDCERLGRRHLVETWQEQRMQHGGVANAYLDTLATLHDAGWLDEYVAHYHGEPRWELPESIDTGAFHTWRRQHHPSFRPETRLIGSWNYAHNVNALP